MQVGKRQWMRSTVTLASILSFPLKWQQGSFHPSGYFSGKVAADGMEVVAGSREEL